MPIRFTTQLIGACETCDEPLKADPSMEDDPDMGFCHTCGDMRRVV